VLVRQTILVDRPRFAADGVALWVPELGGKVSHSTSQASISWSGVDRNWKDRG